jgi:16S rRNA (guanine527-N7)-methyltransferase
VKHPLTLAGLADRFALDAHQLAQLAALLAELENDGRAPTGVREYQRALEAHIADSLVALELDELRGARSLADLGSGAGMPGAALAVAQPRCEVRLVESQARRCAFLEALIRAANITNATVVCARVEDWAGGLAAHDAVSARALAPQPVVLEYAAPLLRVGGALVDWRGRRERDEERAAGRAAERLGLELAEVRRVVPYPQARDLHLHVFMKVAETPAGFPRRPGMARKRPLGP